MQTQGSLQDAGLASLLQTVVSERKTGRLGLEAGKESCSLFFLFGHLFHATGFGVEGEAVVVRALSWTGGDYHFDRRAKLIARETITSSPAELIAAAEATDQSAAAAAGFASAPPSLDPIEGATGDVDDGGGITSETEIWSPVPSGNASDSSASWTARRTDAGDPGVSGPLLAGRGEPPLFSPSTSRTARRPRRQSGDSQRRSST